MSEEKGLLSKNLEGVVIDGLDRLIDANGIVELTSDMALALFVPILDNNVADKLKDAIKLPLREAGDLALEGKYQEASEKASEVVTSTMDFPGLLETDEQRIARKLFNVIADIIETELRNKGKG